MQSAIRFLKRAVLLSLLLTSAAAMARAEDIRRPKKLIATGWDKADTGRVLENLEEMEKRPFDGVVLEVVGQDEDGKRVRFFGMFRRGSGPPLQLRRYLSFLASSLATTRS